MNLMGPNHYPIVSCHLMHFFGNMIMIQICLLFAAIIVVKYLFVLFFKNPTAVQGNFWKVGVKQEFFDIHHPWHLFEFMSGLWKQFKFLQQINVKNIALIKQDSNSCVYSLNSLFSTPVQYYKGIMNTSSWWKSSVCLLKSLWAVFFEICIEYVSPNLLANWTLSVLWMTPFLLS